MSTDSLGRFALTSLPPGVYQLEASLLGFEKDSASIELEESDTVDVHFTLYPLGYEPRLSDDLSGEGTSRVGLDSASPLRGCYQIELGKPYGHPIRPYGGPWATKPEGFPGLPQKVEIMTEPLAPDSVELRVRTIEPRDTTRVLDEQRTDIALPWRIALYDDVIWATWTGGPLIWWIDYRLIPADDALVGGSQYRGHEPASRTEPVNATWRRVACS